jgi:bifunctional oligoribonuclease and PAP phosphatase NrnA
VSSAFQSIADAVHAAETIAILSHTRPDGDAIGSQLALTLSLRQLGKWVVAWNENGLPDSLRFLRYSELVTMPPPEASAFDLVIALDTATKSRLGTTLNAVRSAKYWINIDHHVSNPGYGDLNYIDSSAPATGQIIYEFLRSQALPVTHETADALYVAISTDTGSFRYPNTTARAFEIAAQLISAGVNAGDLGRHLYASYPKRRILLLGELLRDARFDAEDRVASLALTRQTKDRYQIKPEDIDGLIDSIRAIDTVVVAIFFEELEDGRIRISMRSKDDRLDVSKLCTELGGGGHVLAAGARARGSLEEVSTRVLGRVINEVSRSF